MYLRPLPNLPVAVVLCEATVSQLVSGAGDHTLELRPFCFPGVFKPFEANLTGFRGQRTEG